MRLRLSIADVFKLRASGLQAASSNTLKRELQTEHAEA
jgi:hypothetical protein